MIITETLIVAGPPEEAWKMFQDIPELARCLPGAEITEDRGDGSYAGTVAVRLGPMTVEFAGEATVEANTEQRSGVVRGDGRDSSGRSTGSIVVRYAIGPHEFGASRIVVDAEIELAGAVAQFARAALVKQVSQQIVREFVGCIDMKLASETPGEAALVEAMPMGGIRFFFSSLAGVVGQFFSRILRR